MKINYLAEKTGLARKYIDKCYSKFPDLLTGTRARVHDGAPWMYNDNAFVLLQKIRDLRDQQKDLREIEEILRHQIGKQETDRERGREARENYSGTEETADKKTQHHTEQNTTNVFVTAIKDMQTEMLKMSEGARDREVRAKDQVIQTLQSKFLLLEESYETKKRREEEQQEEIKRLHIEQEQKNESDRQKSKRRREIVSHIDSLKGKWFVKKKLVKAINELKALG